MRSPSITLADGAAAFPALPGRMLKAREKAGLTQEQVAHRLGKSRAAVSSWESGIEIPRLIHLKAFALICGTKITNLLAGE